MEKIERIYEVECKNCEYKFLINIPEELSCCINCGDENISVKGYYDVNLGKIDEVECLKMDYKELSLVEKYKAALKIANEVDDLRCHIMHIKKTIEELSSGKSPTVVEQVWVDYFTDNL